MKDISRYSSGYATIAYGFDQYDLGTGRGLCTMNLTPFNLNTSGEKVVGKTATMVFGDATAKTLLEIPETTGLAYKSQYNNGEIITITANVPTVAPEGYWANIECKKNGEVIKTLTDYEPRVYYVTTVNPITGSPINMLDMEIDDFGVGNGLCFAYIKGFNYDFMGGKYHLGISSPFEFTN